MLTRKRLLYAIGCILLLGSFVALSARTAPATPVEHGSLQALTAGSGSGSPGYLFQTASASTNAAPNKPSPSPNCPGGVVPDLPKPHGGGGGKKKIPGPVVVPCTVGGVLVTHG